jgi:subtilisin family serine protease
MMFRTAAVILFLFQIASLGAQSRIIFEANPENIPSLATDYQLTIDRAVENRPIYAATATAAAPVITSVLAADPKVLAVEVDQDANVTENQPASLASAFAAAVTEAALNRTMTSYFGASVRAAYVQQPAATLIRLAEAQQMALSGERVIAIIDTGIDPYHPVLSGSVIAGYDFTRETPFVSEFADLDPLSAAALTQSSVAFLDTYAAKLNQSTVAFLDQSTIAFLDGRNLPAAFGHGTMVAGIVHLVAPSAKIMPLKAFRADGSSNLSDIIRAVYYAVDHGASVINMSFSVRMSSPELKRALEYAKSRNVICIASAGNLGLPVKLYPAAYGSVIGVGSTNTLDVRSAFSNYDVSNARTSAPGEALITTFPGNHYAGVWGTSFSAALVTGAVDLMLQAKPSASLSSVKDALDHGVKIEQKMGDARLDLVRSVEHLIHEEDRHEEDRHEEDRHR